MENDLNKNSSGKFFSLPQSAREWLGSETVTDIIIDLNKKHHIYYGKIKVIPRIITQLITHMVSTENFSKEISEHLPLLSAEEINHITNQIKSRILKPIAGTLRSPFNIDINKIKELPPKLGSQARVMELERPHEKTPEPPRKLDDIAPKNPSPKARITEFARQTSAKQQNKSDIQAPAPKKGPGAEVSNPKKPLTLIEKPLE